MSICILYTIIIFLQHNLSLVTCLDVSEFSAELLSNLGSSIHHLERNWVDLQCQIIYFGAFRRICNE